MGGGREEGRGDVWEEVFVFIVFNGGCGFDDFVKKLCERVFFVLLN